MIDAKFTFPDLAEKLRAHRHRIDAEMIVAMQTNRGMLFDNEGAYNGHAKWDSPMLRSGQAGKQRGTLSKSLAPGTPSGEAGPEGIVRVDGSTYTIGTNVAYAAMFNWGTTKMPDGIMRPVRAKALRIPLPSGKKATPVAKALRKSGSDGFIFRKWVKIPPRRFDDITDQDAAQFQAAFTAIIAEVMRG